MTRNQEKSLKKLGIFTIAQAKELGVPQQTLSRLVAKELFLRVGRGLYCHHKAHFSREIDFKIACKKFGPKSVVGGLTALFYYNLIEQVPQQTWMLVPPNTYTKERLYRLIRTKSNLSLGVIEKDGYRIVSVERALLDGLKLATKIGERRAIGAIRRAFAKKLTNQAKLGRVATELNMIPIVAKYSEAIFA